MTQIGRSLYAANSAPRPLPCERIAAMGESNAVPTLPSGSCLLSGATERGHGHKNVVRRFEFPDDQIKYRADYATTRSSAYFIGDSMISKPGPAAHQHRPRAKHSSTPPRSRARSSARRGGIKARRYRFHQCGCVVHGRAW